MACTSRSVFQNILNFARNIAKNDSFLLPRIVCSFDQTRNVTGKPRGSWKGSKIRSMGRKPGWRRRRTIEGQFDEHLTPENKDFLKQVVEDKYATRSQTSPLKEEPLPRQPWTWSTKRSGVVAIKMGVIPQWTKSGKKIFTTLLQVLDNHVIDYKSPEEWAKSQHLQRYRKYWANKYGCQVVGALSSPPHLFSEKYNELFEKSGVPPKRKIMRFTVTPNAVIEPGTPLSVNHFRVGDFVDVQARTIGHGFQGVVKRWGMKGGPASHGVTKSHRRMGSMGGGGDKGGVWKGKKMPGHMGNAWRILRGVKILRINTKYNIMYVHGPRLPGPYHCYIRVYDTILPLKKKQFLDKPPVMPTWYPEDTTEEQKEEEIFDKDLFQFKDDTVVYEDTAKS